MPMPYNKSREEGYGFVHRELSSQVGFCEKTSYKRNFTTERDEVIRAAKHEIDTTPMGGFLLR